MTKEEAKKLIEDSIIFASERGVKIISGRFNYHEKPRDGSCICPLVCVAFKTGYFDNFSSCSFMVHIKDVIGWSYWEVWAFVWGFDDVSIGSLDPHEARMVEDYSETYALGREIRAQYAESVNRL